MSATIQKLEGEPILIVTHEGYLSLKSTEEVTAQIVEILNASETPLYGIIDVRHATTDFPEFLRIVAHQSMGARGTLSHRESYVALVGAHFWLRLFRSLMGERQFGGVTLAIYYTMEEALTATRLRIRMDATRAG